MHRMLVLIVAAAFALTTAASAQAQYVNMTGDWYNHGITVKLPVKPVADCVAPTAACPRFTTPFITQSNANISGVNGPAATIMGGLGLDDGFTFPGSVWSVPRLPIRTIQVPANFAVQQLNTTLAWRFPGPDNSLILNEPANPNWGRFARDGWMSTGAGGLGGQPGRLAQTTSPIKISTNTELEITIKYKNPSETNPFGGTMAVLQEGNGNLYLNGAALGSSMYPTALQPAIATQMLNSATGMNMEPGGAGWDATNMGGQPAGAARGGAAVATDCVQNIPPLPVGCELVINQGVIPITFVPIVSAVSTRRGWAFTTGTVTITNKQTNGGGGPGTQTIQIAGTNSVTVGGARNIGLVAGRFARRVSSQGVRTNANVHGVAATFVPEPASTVALFAGIGALGVAVRRRMR